MNASTQDQLAASRMLTARLHVALKSVIDAYDSEPPDMTPATTRAIDEARPTLNHSEPEILALLADADRELKVDRLVEAARLVVAALPRTGEVDPQKLADAVTALEAALP